MEQKGIWRDEYHSKTIDKVLDEDFELVVTVCDHANETCPLWLKQGEKIHIGFEDPAAFLGTDEEKLAVFRKTFDLMRTTIPPALSKYED